MLVDLTKIICTSTGTGPFSLGANAFGYFGVEQLTDGATYSYSVQQSDGSKEYGRGVYTASNGQLTRNVIKSSVGTSPIAIISGSEIAFGILAEDVGIGDMVGPVGFLPFRTAIGATPDNALYEIGSGGQALLGERALQLAAVQSDRLLLTGVVFNDTPKPVAIQFAKSRGNGILNDPGYTKKSLADDRLFILGFYGGRDIDEHGNASLMLAISR